MVPCLPLDRKTVRWPARSGRYLVIVKYLFHPIYIKEPYLSVRREQMDDTRRLLYIGMISFMFILPFIPPAAGDGMPVYTYVKEGQEAGDLYGQTFESRQLANIELLNSTHQRIDLFLSVFSLDPSENLTILVPFRELPEEVDMERTNDTMFLQKVRYDRIVEESDKQDLGMTTGRFAERSGNGMKDLGVSTVTSPLGLLTIRVAEDYLLSHDSYMGEYDREASGGGAEQASKEVKEVSHYDFDGASVSVYSVSANATLEDFLAVVDMGTLPSITRAVVEEYREQYVAVIESEPSPPIPAEDYDWLIETMPETMDRVISLFESNERLSFKEVEHEAVRMSYQGFHELVRSDYNTSGIDQDRIDRYISFIEEWEWNGDDSPFDILGKMETLFFSVYGFSDFQGNTLSVTSQLNDGKLYYPLGTSKGWNNPIQDTIVIMRVTDDSSLELNIEPDHKAFLEDEHCYVVEYFDSNPESDLVGEITDVKSKEKMEAGISRFVHSITGFGPFITALMIYLLLWFLLIFLFKRSQSRSEMGVLSWKNLLMGLLNLLISAPITYLLMVYNPVSGEKRVEDAETRRIYTGAYAAFILINIFFIIWRIF